LETALEKIARRLRSGNAGRQSLAGERDEARRRGFPRSGWRDAFDKRPGRTPEGLERGERIILRKAGKIGKSGPGREPAPSIIPKAKL